MIVFNAPEKLLQDIAAVVGVRVVIATDNAAELADEMREPIVETYEPTAKESEWLLEQLPFAPSPTDPQPDEGTDNRASTQWREHGYY